MINDTKLYKSSQIALKNFMGVNSDETLLVISDENLRNIGMQLYLAGQEIAKESVYVEMKQRDVNGQEPPESIAELMKYFDVVICPTTKSLTHTQARREASKLGIRVGTMPGITEETMNRCFSAKPEKIVEMTEFIAEKMSKVTKVKITTKLGTDFAFSIKNRKVLASTGVLTNIGDSGNIPSGEVYVAPVEKKSGGKIVFDGSFAGIGLLDDPITVEVIDGYAESIIGEHEAELLTQILDKVGREARNVAEFGIGTNYKAKLCGDILGDEKVLGTIHIAFGNNMSMGGVINVPIHLDGLVKKPTVFFDNEEIMRDGKFLIY